MSAQDLAAAVRARRVALGGLTQIELEVRGGPSHGVIRNVEQAARDDYTDLTLGRLDRVLGWRPGSARRLLIDGTPAEFLDPPRDESSPPAAVLSDDTLRALTIGRLVLALWAELQGARE